MGTITTSTLNFDALQLKMLTGSLIRVNGEKVRALLQQMESDTLGVRLLEELPESVTTNLVFTAIDNKNNNSGTANPDDVVKRLSAINLQIST